MGLVMPSQCHVNARQCRVTARQPRQNILIPTPVLSEIIYYWCTHGMIFIL
jgi:hypothetical protein